MRLATIPPSPFGSSFWWQPAEPRSRIVLYAWYPPSDAADPFPDTEPAAEAIGVGPCIRGPGRGS